MITALISALTGLFSGVLPDLIKEIKETRAASREVEFLKLNHQLTIERAKLEAGAKLEESYSQQMIAEINATKEQIISIVTAQSTATGIIWIDGFNALIRPLTAFAFVAVFVSVIGGASFGLTKDPAFSSALVPLFSEGIMAVLGFLFGYRSVASSKRTAA